jgi:signal transduction histidine kinase
MERPVPDSLLTSAAARLSHEIRNSLAGIAGAIDVLEDYLPRGAALEDVMVRIRKEVLRIEGSVKELARFAEPTTAVLRRKDVHEVIDEALHGSQLVASTRVKRDYGVDLPLAPIDERLLRDALHRLFLNAQDAMPSGGELSVATSWGGNRIVITIRDTGTGIDSDELGLIFEPFYSRKTRGLGLGLAIVRRLIEAHGGSVSAGSAGGGAEIVISLPADPGVGE